MHELPTKFLVIPHLSVGNQGSRELLGFSHSTRGSQCCLPVEFPELVAAPQTGFRAWDSVGCPGAQVGWLSRGLGKAAKFAVPWGDLQRPRTRLPSIRVPLQARTGQPKQDYYCAQRQSFGCLWSLSFISFPGRLSRGHWGRRCSLATTPGPLL